MIKLYYFTRLVDEMLQVTVLKANMLTMEKVYVTYMELYDDEPLPDDLRVRSYILNNSDWIKEMDLQRDTCMELINIDDLRAFQHDAV